MRDPVNHPDHYKRGGVECIDLVEAIVARFPGMTGFRLGNVVKYVFRHLDKGDPLENLKKARWYLDREIEKYEEGK